MKDFGKNTLIIMSVVFALKIVMGIISKYLSVKVADPVVVDSIEAAMAATFLVANAYLLCTYGVVEFMASLLVTHHACKVYSAIKTSPARKAAMPSFAK